MGPYRTTLLIGLSSPDLQVHHAPPGRDILLLTAKLLTGEEGNFVIQNGAEGRNQLVELFSRDNSYHVSSLGRKSVI